jgi:hypothetical protein
VPRHRRVIDADYYEEDERPDRSGRPERSERSERSDRSSRRSRRDENSPKDDNVNLSNNRNLGLDLNNIDLNQIAGLMQNVDINKLSSILSGLGGATKRTNSDGQGALGGLNDLGGILNGLGGIEGLAGIVNSLGGIGGLTGMLGGLLGSGTHFEGNENIDRAGVVPYTGDRRVDLLYALKSVVTPERSNIIDMIVQIYTISKILKR